ncbi:hypothetical protein [Pandoraea sputorum]
MTGKKSFDWTQKSTRKLNDRRKIPTAGDFAEYDGHHCHLIYKSLPPGWQCPGCGRTPFQILRWTMRFPHLPSKFMGWAGGYHQHHDHAGDREGYFSNSPDARFPKTIMCEQCNAADATVKRTLKLPKAFSYSPEEIRAFVESVPHGKHVINYPRAAQIYESVTGCAPQVMPGAHTVSVTVPPGPTL